MLVQLGGSVLGFQGGQAPLHLPQLCLCMLELVCAALCPCLCTTGAPARVCLSQEPSYVELMRMQAGIWYFVHTMTTPTGTHVPCWLCS